jgi:hypothetical protein
MKKLILPFAMFITILYLPMPIHAAIISYGFSGSVTQVTDPDNLLSGISIAPITSTFTGTFRYDDSQSSTVDFGSTAKGYPGVEVTVQVDGTYNFIGNDPFVQIGNNGGFGDHFSIADRDPDTVFDINVGDFQQLQVFLSDSSATVFHDLSLPSTLDLSDFDGRKLLLRGGIYGALPGSLDSQYIIDGVITSLNPLAVPVPGAVWLFGSGMLGLIGIYGRK